MPANCQIHKRHDWSHICLVTSTMRWFPAMAYRFWVCQCCLERVDLYITLHSNNIACHIWAQSIVLLLVSPVLLKSSTSLSALVAACAGRCSSGILIWWPCQCFSYCQPWSWAASNPFIFTASQSCPFGQHHIYWGKPGQASSSFSGSRCSSSSTGATSLTVVHSTYGTSWPQLYQHKQ